MSAVSDIKDLLSGQFSDGYGPRLSCYVNTNVQKEKNCIMLFNTGADRPLLALGYYAKIGYYSREVEVAIRHGDYDKAEEISFQALKHLGNNRRNTNLSLYFTENPIYKGIDNTG